MSCCSFKPASLLSLFHSCLLRCLVAAPRTFGDVAEEKIRKRACVISELIKTEAAYANDLLEVHTVFFEPMRKSGLLSQQQLDEIVRNWMDLYRFSVEFHSELQKESRLSSGQHSSLGNLCIGSVILQRLTKFDVFVQYSVNQEFAIHALQHYLSTMPRLASLVRDCEQCTRTKGLFLSDYLLKPLQRLTKYRLLLERICDSTDSDHPDFTTLSTVMQQLNTFLDCINGAVGTAVTLRRLKWLRQHLVGADNLPADLFPAVDRSRSPCLLYYGTLYKAKSNRELVAFLFPRYLLLTYPLFPTGGRPFQFPGDKAELKLHVYRQPISLDKVTVAEGTSIQKLDVSKLFRSHSAMSILSPSSNQTQFDRSKTPHSPNSECRLGSQDAIKPLATGTTFSLFLASDPWRPLIRLKASTTTERDGWIASIWNAIWLSRPSLPAIGWEPHRFNRLRVSVVRCWMSDYSALDLSLEFTVGDQPHQSSSLSIGGESEEPTTVIDMTFSCTNPETEPLHIWAFDQSGFPEPIPMGDCVIPLADVLPGSDLDRTEPCSRFVNLPQSTSVDLQLVLTLQLIPSDCDNH